MDVHLHTICSSLLVISIAGLLCSSITTTALDPKEDLPKEDVDTPAPLANDDQHLQDLEHNDGNVESENDDLENQEEMTNSKNEMNQEAKDEADIADLSKSTIPATTVSTTHKSTVEEGDFTVKSDDKICLRAALKATFTVKYASIRSGKKKLHDAVINLPRTVSVSGTCDTNHSSLLISWSNSSFVFKIDFEIVKGGKSKRDADTKLPGWSAASISFTFNTKDDTQFQSPTHAGKHTVTTKPGERYFIAERNQSYACKSREEVELQEYFKNSTVNTADIDRVDVEIWNAHVQAFDIPPSGKFSQTLICEKDVINSLPRRKVVPIIVAACLAGLIIIIIVAYFISKNIGHSAYRPMA